MTPLQLRRLAEQAFRSAAELEREAKLQREQGAEFLRMADVADATGLTIRRKRSKLGSNVEGISTEGKSKGARIAIGRTRVVSTPKRLLLERGLTDESLAAELTKKVGRVARATVNAWFSGRRTPPEAHKVYLRDTYGVPVDSWPAARHG